MFKPNFKYTHKIVNNLVEITSAREVILSAYLIPKWGISLRREALIRATHASTAIEGNPLTLEEVSKLAQGRKVSATRRVKQEVLNYLKVLENIERYQEGGRITENKLLKLHEDVTRHTLENSEWEGTYRKIQVYVGNRITGEVIFMPSPPENVPKLVMEFAGWINSKESYELHPVLVAGISHYELARIHPFVDGNGRTARALATLILYSREFDIKRFFTMDDYYDMDRRAYYNALGSVNQKSFDLTSWVEYFTEGVKVSISRVREKILQLSLEGEKIRKKGQIALTERQMKIIQFIQVNERITVGNVAKMFNITRQSALKELFKFVKLEVIKLEGKGRGAHYVLV